MKIGIITVEDLNDKKAWSGIIYKIYRQLCSLYGEENIVHLHTKVDWIGRFYIFIYKCIAHIFDRDYSSMDCFVSKRLATSVRETIALKEVKVIFAPAGAMDIAYLTTEKPIIYYSDATFKLLYGYYPLNNLFQCKYIEALYVEKKAMEKADILLYASHWAKQSAVIDYDIPPSKSFVVQFGANIEDKDIKFRKRTFLSKKEKVKFLFLGVDWERKGGIVAVDCCISMMKKGFDVELHVVGIPQLPLEYNKYDFLINHGFLNKNKREDYLLLISIIDKCDILLLPTKAECAGIVFAEASAFGLPIFTYDTGGVADYVINGVNGYRLPINHKGKDFADKIYTLLMEGKMEKLSIGGRRLYEERLNWEHWGKEFDCALKLIMK